MAGRGSPAALREAGTAGTGARHAAPTEAHCIAEVGHTGAMPAGACLQRTRGSGPGHLAPAICWLCAHNAGPSFATLGMVPSPLPADSGAPSIEGGTLG